MTYFRGATMWELQIGSIVLQVVRRRYRVTANRPFIRVWRARTEV